MKIISQTSDQMALKDGNISGIIIGAVLILGAGYFAYHTYSASGISNTVWIALAVVIFGLLMLLLSSTITVTINKTQNQLVFRKQRLLGGSTKAYNTQDVLRVELRKGYRLEQAPRANNSAVPSSREVLTYQSVLVLKDGDEIPLENIKSSGNANFSGAVLMPGTGKELSMANQVATFLGVPCQEIGPGPAPTILGSGGSGINIKL